MTSDTIVTAHSLGWKTREGKWIVRNTSFNLLRGEVSVIAGKNGVGKSIFAQMMSGLLTPSEGDVTVCGQQLNARATRPASVISYVHQDARLSVLGEFVEDDLFFGPENLGMSSPQKEELVERALTICNMQELRHAETQTLSMGELRRLSIASACAMNTPVLILDEPFANLDLPGVMSVLAIIRELKARYCGIIVITHELEKIISIADTLSIMDHGEIVKSGPNKQLLGIMNLEDFGIKTPCENCKF